jgi:hypothetical protein
MKKIFYSILSAALCLTLASCTDFLTRSPYDKIGADEFFTSENDLLLYSNGLLQKYLPDPSDVCYGDQWADYLATVTSTDFFKANGVTPDSQTGWSEGSWTMLRNCNYMIENMPKCKNNVSTEVYNHYMGVARFWRAYFYYNKVQLFGDVPWYDHVVSASDSTDLMRPRDSREVVMDHVLEDLTYASENCLATSKFTANSAYINKYVALAFKSRVCLYEGTFRKYHSVNPSTNKAWSDANGYQKFLTEAASAAEELMNSGAFRLYSTGKPATDYSVLFKTEKVNTTEDILAMEYNASLSVTHEMTWRFTSPTYGQKWSFTKQFVNTYLMADGTPFTSTDGYATKGFKDEFTGRDPRMAQTMITPSYQKKVSGVLSSFMPNFIVSRTGYTPIKWNIDDDAYESQAISYNSIPLFRYAEVLLNYAEAKAELGTFTEADWNKTIALIRARAGVKSVIPTEADPYMQAYFLNTVTDKWILEIRRERGCELALEDGLRWDDDMRWGMGELLGSDKNPWLGMYLPSAKVGSTYDFNGDGVIDFTVKASGADETKAIAIGTSGADVTFSLSPVGGTSGNLVYNIKRIWSDEKYVHPIPTAALTRNPHLTQNSGW